VQGNTDDNLSVSSQVWIEEVVERVEVFNRVNILREQMDRKWGDLSIAQGRGDSFVVTLLAEEVGEVARAVLEKDGENLKDELIDIMQICTAWLEAL
jgi:hypothetical protein